MVALRKINVFKKALCTFQSPFSDLIKKACSAAYLCLRTRKGARNNGLRKDNTVAINMKQHSKSTFVLIQILLCSRGYGISEPDAAAHWSFEGAGLRGLQA